MNNNDYWNIFFNRKIPEDQPEGIKNYQNQMVNKIRQTTKQEEDYVDTRPKYKTIIVNGNYDRAKVASDGLSTDYYLLPKHATELRHLISYKSMSKSRGDIFKACYRLGEKKGVDVMYDLNKMKFFIEDLIEMYKRGEHL